MAWKKQGRKDNDGKYLRLTGLWQNKKKDNLFTGKMKAEDVVRLIDKAQEADESHSDLVFFLWVNDQEKRTDPEFTLQVSVSEGEVGSSRGRKSYGRGRDDCEDRSEREEERDNKRSKRDEPEETEEAEEEPEEKPRRGKPAPASKSRKADKDDW